MTTIQRHRAGQPIPDDGSCWRHLAERQNCTAATFHDSRPPLDHTNSAHLIGDAEDSRPGPVQMYGPERMRLPGALLFVAGVMCGAVACAWVMLP
jgi:hypothetical protein